MKIRKARKGESGFVLAYLSTMFPRNVIEKMFSKNELLIQENKWKEFFLANKRVIKLCRVLKDVYFAGFFIGETRKMEKVKISLELAYEISKLTNKKKIIVNKFAEQPFLYGKDVLSSSIVEFDREIKKGNIVLVCNGEDECLGIGMAVLDSKEFGRRERIAVRNIIDRGWYLRRGE